MMKRIFTFLLLALAVPVNAAFIAQNGMTISNGLNVATGVISGNSSGTTNYFAPIALVHNGSAKTSWPDLGTAISNAVPGDWVLLSSAVFNVTNPITIPVGVSVQGEGRGSIVRNWADLSNGVCISLSTNTYLGYLQITNANMDNQYQGCVGAKNNQNANQPPFDAITDHLVCYGDSDSWYLNVNKNIRWTDYQSEFNSKWDSGATQPGAGGPVTFTYLLYGTRFISKGPSVWSPGASARCFIVSPGVTLNLTNIGCTFSASGAGSGANSVIDTSAATCNGVLDGCSILAGTISAGPGTLIFRRTSLPASFSSNGASYDNNFVTYDDTPILSTEFVDFRDSGFSFHDIGVGDNAGITNYSLKIDTNGVTLTGTGTKFRGNGGGMTNVGFNAVTKTSNFTIPSTWVEATISNKGASGDTTNTLPAGLPGMQFTAVGEAAHFIAFKVQPGEVIHNFASSGFTNAWTSASAVPFANFTVKCTSAGVWWIQSQNGLTIGTQ